MRIKFELEDEKTVTNDTVKVFVTVTGPIGTATRETLETRARKALSAFIPDASWAFAGFKTTRSSNIPIYMVNASTRIPASLNDDLVRRASEQENPEATLQVTQIDESVPLRELRSGYAEIRKNVLDLALAEAKTLSTNDRQFRVLDIDFTEEAQDVRGKFSASTANYSNSGCGAGGSIGYSTKLNVSATVTLTDGYDESDSIVLTDNRD